ncbi:fimbria/pilus outer membrane usher protein [Luteibacter yeojuensis]|uniref:Fimbrial biogenesis outer membrane usher protein n=1 Tax=Luteibacter yeojuensis TaxID=345309 RepID=A0A7X5QUX4_9GAMM|nr:fimbria/pilus outer membrane usher protein [Luteibacter yeojuensis]NID15881.1 fimbrial biogenesis outer membrane usher protein [Luteibacter yeojuensis]
MTVRVAQAQDTPVVFDAAFLQAADAAALDMSRFALGNPVLPGDYDVDVWMNGEWQARKSVRFVAHGGGADAGPCIAREELVAYGLDPASLPAVDDDPCLPMAQRVASATTRFDVSEQRLDIEVPQAAMSRRRPGAVPPGQWDHGMTAGLLAWRAGARRTDSPRRSDASVHADADAGVNVGPWRLRHAASLSGGHYSRRHAYVERPVAEWRAQLRTGVFPLGNGTFPAIQLRGISLASDARMAADALAGYAPRVKGIAAAHATVRITQNGILLRELVVPPGPFEVDDLHAAGRGGDIQVDIEEHGRHRTFRVPFFPVPELLREGSTAYTLSAGRGMVGRGRSHGVVQADGRHGFPGELTGHAGGRLSRGIASLVVGGAIATLGGAFALDIARSRRSGSGSTGLWRMRHGRQWADGTLVSLGMAKGREGVSRAMGGSTVRADAMRRIDVLIQKDFGGRGILGVNASHVAHARGKGGALEQAVSWTRTWGRLGMDVSLRRSRRHDLAGRFSETAGQVNVSMPLGATASAARLHATALAGAHADGARLGIHGNVGEAAETRYGAAVGRDRRKGSRFDASVSRRMAAGEVVATIDSSPVARAGSLSASGGLIFHRGGITPAQRLGDAVALVQARGAQGAGVAGGTGARIGRRGHAVVPHLTPYRWNTVDLDPAGTSLDVGFVATHRRVAPTAGAVVLVAFETELAKTVLVAGRLADGRPLPFGAEVLDSQDRSVGLVGQGGRIFLRTERTDGQWTVRWSGDATGRCVLRIAPDATTAAGEPRLTGACE